MSPLPAMAQGMAVSGEASVSETGAARYSIPIATPPGTAGMVPSLSLSYDSHSGNGLLGMGWQLEGLAAIGRCPRTLVQDGVRGGINYDANDRFCLDGQRLIAVSGTYGADGTEYRTEIESFTKVVSRGVAGTGPAWFEVRTKSGQVMEFGNSTDSRILAQGKPTARSWAVNRVADTKGNAYAVVYVNDAVTGEAYPSRIDYTGNAGAGLAPYNTVRFVYDAARPDAATAYHVGSMVRSSVRMSKVQTYAGAALVSDYRFSFAQGASTGRSQLTSVTICDGSGACLPATSFTWQQGTTNYTVVNNVGGQDGQLVDYRPYVGDFNGDGLADIFWDSGADGSDDRSSGNHVLWTNTGNSGFQVTPNWLNQDGTTVSVPQASCNNLSSVYYPFIADFNRDGRSDVLWYNKTCGHKNVANARESKTREWFSNANGSYVIQAGPNKPNRRGGDDSYYSYELRLVEINGDNRVDIIWHKGNDNSQLIWAMQQTGSVIESILTTQLTLPPSDPFYFGNWYAGGKAFQRSSQVDFNADGKTDILWLKSDTEGLQFVSLGDGQNTFTQASGSDSSVDSFSPTYGDLNGDGQTDILWDNTDGRGRSEGTRLLWLSQGNGNFVKFANAGGQNGTLSTSQHRPYIADFNGDGLPDVLWDAEDDDSARTTGQRVLWTATGQNQFAVNTNFSGLNGTLVNYAPSFGDFNGDGKTDILWDRQVEDNTRSQGQRVLWLSDGIAPDLITSVTNGLGATVSVNYKSMSDGAVYAKDNTAIDPVVDMQGAIQIVARVDQSNGIGGNRSIAYAYAGAKAHQDGRGFLGFREVRTTDLSTGLIQTTTYRQDFPLTGLVAQETNTRGGVTLGTSVNTHTATDLGGGRRQVTLTQSDTAGADLNGQALPSANAAYLYDTFGNTTQVTVTNSDGYSKTTTNTYSNDAVNWLLGRLVTATVTSQAPSVAQQAPAEDTTPATFDFTDVLDASPGVIYEDSAGLSGFNRPATATVSGAGAQIRKNAMGDWSTSVPVNAGDVLNVRLTSNPAYGAAVTTTVTVAGVSADWVVSNMRAIVISSNINNFNLRAAHDSLYPAPTGSESPPARVKAIIAPNVIVGSTSIATAAFDVGAWPTGIPVTVEVKGRIQGAGGQGGRGDRYVPENGQKGGTAFVAFTPVTLDVISGQIIGGGGGGGGGLGGSDAGGGGGGAGQVPGLGGAAYRGAPNGSAGTAEAGGQGGQDDDPGGNGGNSANAGTSGTDGNAAVSSGGAPGAAIRGTHFITQVGTGDVRGPVRNGLAPDSFTFPDVYAGINQQLQSSAVLSQFYGAVTASVSGGGAQIRKNGTGTWGTSVPVASGDTLNIRMTASSEYLTSVMSTVSFGSTTASWTITTEPAPPPDGGGG